MKNMCKQFIKQFKLQIKDIRKGNIKKQIPNILTFSRALAPFIIIPSMINNNMLITIIALIIFAITDFFDGRIARKYNLVSDFGIKLDAVCDKIFAISLVIPAVIIHKFLGINLLLEFLISFVNVYSESKGNNPQSNIMGKIKTTFLSITIILVYIPHINKLFILITSIITLITQIIALIKYILIDKEKDKNKK